MARILIMDDSEIVLAIAGNALTRAGHTIATATTFAELSERIEGPEFDLILMDVQLPELYGDDVAGVLRHTRAIKGRIYLYSSLEVDQLATRTVEAGLDGYISNGDGVEEMVAKVRAILAG